jgi:hypothetical protein
MDRGTSKRGVGWGGVGSTMVHGNCGVFLRSRRTVPASLDGIGNDENESYSLQEGEGAQLQENLNLKCMITCFGTEQCR